MASALVAVPNQVLASVPSLSGPSLVSCSMLFSGDLDGENLNHKIPLAFRVLNPSMTLLLNYLDRYDVRLLFDRDPESLDEGQKSLRRLFLNTPPTEFNSIWSMISKKELLILNEIIESGDISATPVQKERLGALIGLAKSDSSRSIWSENSWKTFLESNPSYRGPGYTRIVGGMIGGIDTKLINDIEDQVFKAARGEASKIGPGRLWQRVVWPPYKAAMLIHDFNTELRRKLVYVDQIREVFARELRNANLASFTAEELERMDHIRDLVEQERKEVIGALELAYHGRIDENNGRFSADILDLYQIASNIKNYHLLESLLGLDPMADLEIAMVRFDYLLQDVRKRTSQLSRTEDDMSATELQIRHGHFLKSSVDSFDRWKKLMNRSTNVTLYVEYHYTDLEVNSRINAGGKPETFIDVVTRHGMTHKRVSYKELFLDRLAQYSVGREMTTDYHKAEIDFIRGKDGILKEAGDLIALESQNYGLEISLDRYRAAFENYQKLVSAFFGDRALYESVYSELINQRAVIVQKIWRLVEITQKPNWEVARLWRGEDYQQYIYRNDRLLDAWREQLELFEALIAQVKSFEKDLLIHAPSPDRTEDLKGLKRSFWAKAGGIGLAGLSAVAAPVLYHTDPNFHQSIDAMWSFLSSYLGTNVPATPPSSKVTEPW